MSLESSSSKKNMTSETLPSKENMISSPSSIWKSECIEKGTLTTPPVQRKSESVGKQTESISLRGSESGKNLSSPISSGSKKSDESWGSSEMKLKKGKKDKNVKQLTMETKEVSCESEKQDTEQVQVQKKRISAHSYRALLKRNKNVKAKVIDQNKELNRMAKSSQGNSSYCEDDSSRQVNEVRGMSGDAEQAHVDCSREENLQSPELLYIMENGTLDDIGLKRGQNVMPLKRKRNEVDMVSDASAVVASKETSVPLADATPLSPTRCPEICGDKKQRIISDSTDQEILLSCLPTSKEKNGGDLCDASSAKDRGELQVSTTTELAAKCQKKMQQNGFHVDSPACVDEGTCFICNHGGKLLCCHGRGCRRSCHFSCLAPPSKVVPFGAWHCTLCVKKKIESGVHSLSGVESIWDAKEVDVLDVDGLTRRKEYFVKYKGLAHVHNRWVPESQLVSEVPLLVAKFNRKHQVVRWKQEWTLPYRLLQRRCLTSTKQHDEHIREHAGEDSDCHYEWLVKWHGLDHEYATWELENTFFINSPQGQRLIRDYEDRRKRAKQASSSSIEKEQKLKTSFPLKLSHLSSSGSSGFDNNLDCVDKLREYWHKRQNAIVFNEQDRFVKVVLFIISLLSDVTRPFLIISASSVLHLWEDRFLRMAPSTDVMIYSGNIETRKCIRTSEFYDEGGCIMFQALITSPEVIIEDLNVFESIGWEAIIIDECQHPKITSHFKQFKMISTGMRILLVSGQLKDSITEYRNMLSVLEAHGGLHRSADLMVDAKDNVGSLKEKLAKYVAYGAKLDSSRFVEYWIPVQISDVQLEQYCATLLSNSLSLCSPLKHDHIGAFHDILISTRKCCDHPYLVDKSLQSLLVKDLIFAEYLDVGIKACGKLQLLDTMLSELKNQGSKVLILFQAVICYLAKECHRKLWFPNTFVMHHLDVVVYFRGQHIPNGTNGVMINSYMSIGGGRESVSMGDILDDFLCKRFGSDSYERVDRNVSDSKKKSAQHNFNNRSERFVFLLETCACRSSIKLSSVHTVIIFHSDWCPLNDLRALQRITLDSQLQLIKVFRLYSSCTVEEKVLILAKRDKTPDNYMRHMRASTSHVLLRWGASYLFNRLDRFHSGTIPASSSNNFFEQSLLKDAVQEFLTILTQTGEDDDKSKFNIISKVKQNQGTYCTTPLFGESRVEGMDEELPQIFWTKCLEGINPCWKYSSGLSQGSRKRVRYYDDLQKKLEAENDDVVKKQRKVANNCVNQSSLKPGLEEGKIFLRDKEGTSAHSDTIHWEYASASTLDNNISETSRELSYSQKSLHLLLKPEMAKLCEVLQLREDAKEMVEKFLEYIMINHHVKTEPATILQAFEISLCWTAASLRKQKIDHKASLVLAKQHLHFSCKKEEADYVYSLLQCLKGVFELSMKEASNYQSNARLSQLETSDMAKVKVEVDDWSAGQVCSDKQDHFKVAQKDFSRSIRRIKKKCRKQMAKLIQKQLEEKEDINKKYKGKKTRLDHKKRTEAAFILHSYCHGKMQKDSLKVVDIKYAKQVEKLKHKRDMRLRSLEAPHVASMNKVREKETSWVEGVKSWLQAELSNKPSSNEFGHSVDCLQAVEQRNARDNQENGVSNSICISEGQNPNKFVNITLVCREGGVESPIIQETMPDVVVVCSNPFETVAGPLRLDTEGGELEIIASEETSVAGLKEQIEVGNSSNNHVNDVFLNPCSREQILDGDMLSVPGGHIQSEVPETIGSIDGAEDCLPPVHSSDGQIHDGARLSPKGQVPGEVAKTISSNGLDDDVPVNAPSSIHQIPDAATTSMPDGEVLLSVPAAASSSNYTENFMNSPPYEEQINTGTLLDVPDEEVPLTMLENVYPRDGLENVISLNPSSIEQFPDGATSFIPSAELLRVPESSPGEIVERSNINGDNYEAYATISENINHILHLQEQSVVNSPSVQTNTIEDRPVPSNHALQVVCSEHTGSTGVKVGDAAASEIQIALQVEPLPRPVYSVASNESNHGAAAPEPVVSGVGHQPSSETCFANQFAQSPTVVVENRVELSNQALAYPVATSALNPPTGPSTDRLGANSMDPRTGIVFSGYINDTAQSAAPVASLLTQHMIPDPLQNELERLRRSADEPIRIHEETKLKVKADCDREIEEAITQIRRKYEIKLQEEETEFMLRKQELDANENKVLMNKIVAEAFRSLMDMKSSGAGMQQGVSSSPIHELLALTPSQHTAQRPPVFTCPSGPPAASLHAIGTPAVTSPAASQHTAVTYSSAPFSSIPSRPPVFTCPTGPPAASLHAIGTPAVTSPAASQHTAVTYSSAPFSSIPSRPPVFTCPSGPPAASLHAIGTPAVTSPAASQHTAVTYSSAPFSSIPSRPPVFTCPSGPPAASLHAIGTPAVTSPAASQHTAVTYSSGPFSSIPSRPPVFTCPSGPTAASLHAIGTPAVTSPAASQHTAVTYSSAPFSSIPSRPPVFTCPSGPPAASLHAIGTPAVTSPAASQHTAVTYSSAPFSSIPSRPPVFTCPSGPPAVSLHAIGTPAVTSPAASQHTAVTYSSAPFSSIPSRPPVFTCPSGPPAASLHAIGTPAVTSPAASQHTAVTYSSAPFSSIPSRPPVFTCPSGPPAVTSPAASQHTAVTYSSAPFSSIPSRPPHISSRIFPTVNHVVGRGIHAPAPHLQTFRPSTSLASTSVSSSVFPSLPSSPRPTSLPLLQRPLLPPLAAYDLGLYNRVVPAYNYGHFNRAPGSEASVVVPSLSNFSQSAMDLLMDFGSSVPNFRPESTLRHGTVANPAQTGEPGDIVCLSDDD